MAHEHKIRSVEEGGIAWEMGIEPGDKLLTREFDSYLNVKVL